MPPGSLKVVFLLPKSSSKQSFLHGALILTLATAVVKVIGALFTIPLANLLTGEGMGYFYTAYDIYNVLLVVSTAGLPVAMSRMVSEAEAKGRYGEVSRIFNVSMFTFLIIGAAGSAGMFFYAHSLADLMRNSNAWRAVMALSPAVFFVALMSAFRGYFQGRSNMTPTAVSQVIEALSKLVVGFGLAWWFVHVGAGLEKASAGAIAGVTLGTVLGTMYLFFCRARDGRPAAIAPENQHMRTSSQIFKALIKIAVPITIGASVLSVVNFIDTMLVLRRLQDAAGFTQEMANWLYGAYGNAKKIFNFPAAFIVPFSVSIIPALTTALAKNDKNGVTRTVEASLRIMSLLAMPAGVGLMVLSWPILNVIYFAIPDEVNAGAPLLAILGIATVVNCVVLLTNAILQAFGRVGIPVLTMAIGGVVKIVTNWFLVGTPSLNILGAPIGTCLCYTVIAVMNILFIMREIPQAPNIFKVFSRPLVASVLMGGVAWGAYTLLARVTGARVGVMLAILLAGAVYLVLVVALRAITREDLLLLPKGRKIADLLRIR